MKKKVIPIKSIPKEVKFRSMDEILKEKQQIRREKIKEIQKKYGLTDEK